VKGRSLKGRKKYFLLKLEIIYCVGDNWSGLTVKHPDLDWNKTESHSRASFFHLNFLLNRTRKVLSYTIIQALNHGTI
jgi:hypothetical protein